MLHIYDTIVDKVINVSHKIVTNSGTERVSAGIINWISGKHCFHPVCSSRLTLRDTFY